MKTLGAIAAIAVCSLAHAQGGFEGAKSLLKVGNWNVLQTRDKMTDEVKCTGIFKNNFDVQLTADALYIAIRGGIQGVTFRFGEKPANPLRLADDMENKVDALIIKYGDLAEAVSTKRLRVQVSTMVRGVSTLDLDTTGIAAAHERIKTCSAKP